MSELEQINEYRLRQDALEAYLTKLFREVIQVEVCASRTSPCYQIDRAQTNNF